MNGFTLLEVLIAVSIMSLIVSVIYASFSTTGHNVEQAESTRDAMDLARTLLTKISSDIENAYINPGMNVRAVTTIFYGKKEKVETGNEERRYDGLTLTTLTNWRKPDSKETDLCEVGYYFKQKPDGSGYVLMRREKRELGSEMPATEGGVEYAITDRVASLQLRYYDIQAQAWQDEWDTRTKGVLPRAVEISLLLDDGSALVTAVETGR